MCKTLDIHTKGKIVVCLFNYKMNIDEIINCPGTLSEGFTSYSPSCLRNLFNGKKVNHILPYDSTNKDEDVAEQFMENRKRISISGVQEKLSFILDKNKLRLTHQLNQRIF